MKMRLLFRCDCEGMTGFGHFSRCLSLARTLTESYGTKVTFCGRFDGFAKKALQHYGMTNHEAHALGYSEQDVSKTLAMGKEFDALIVDSYDVDSSYVSGLASQSCKLIFIDDMHLMDFAGADMVINFRAGSESLTYGAKRVALGLEYLVVKPELQKLRMANLGKSKRQINNVLVFFSGRDASPAMLGQAIVMTRMAMPDVSLSYIKNGSPIEGLQDIRHMPFQPEIEELYAEADLIVTGGGLVKYESAYCDIPNIALSQTALQDMDTKILASRYLTHDLGMAEDFDLSVVADKLKQFVNDPTALGAQHNAFRNAMSTDSTQRLASLILSL
jgi:spore coat polysaccharide biosynthesis predicted glycosyltransferase SpsG